MQSYDIVIVGGGMTGLALASGLAATGWRIAVLENQALPEDSALPSTPMLRVSAISPASVALLRYCGAWDKLDASRLTACPSVEVWEKDSFAHINFHAHDYGYQNLAYIVENENIRHALYQRCKESSNIQLFSSVGAEQIVWGEDQAFISLQNGQHLGAKLVVGADGAHSWLRRQANIPLTFRDYGQHALVATVRTVEKHGCCARQIFSAEGILAFLPLYEDNLCSVVWSLEPERAIALKSCETPYFEQQITTAFDGRLGLCRLESERQTYPLTARYAHSFAGHRLALVGDAAHTIHPLAGQGVNLGFMDVVTLIDILRALRQQGRDIGSYYSLRRYERGRKYEAMVMLTAMQGFRQLFAGDWSVKKLSRDLGLTLVDRLPGVKSALMQKIIALNNLPDWLIK